MKKLLVLLPGLLIAGSLFSQNKLIAVKQNERKNAYMDSVLLAYFDSGYIGGATAIVAKDGKIIYHQAVGYSNLQTKKQMRVDDIFRIASQTKAITSVAIMQLFDEGKLKLEDSVAKFIPEYANARVLDKFNEADTTYTTVAANRPVTIKDLLTHSSGIGYAQIGSKTATAIYAKDGQVGGIGVRNLVLGDKMRSLGKLPLMFQPGEKWMYGLSTDVLGYVVEVVSGMTLDDYFAKKIFAPLGMKDTYFYLPESKYNRLVTVNTEDSTRHAIPFSGSFDLSGPVLIDYPATKETYFSGGGGLSSTALDYAIFMQMLLNKGAYGGKKIISPEAVRLMTTEQFNTGWPDKTMGLGFSIYKKESAGQTPLAPGSYEWGGFFSSTYWIDPVNGVIGQLFLNHWPNSHEEIHDKFKQAVYRAIK